MGTIAAVVLAGGRGERLGGVIKANLEIGGVRLLDRVAARLAGADHLLIAHGPLNPATMSLDPAYVPLPDLPSNYAGPLAGLAAAAAWCSAQSTPPDILVCAAVDTPFLPETYLSRLVEALDAGPAVICRHASQDYPTNSAWRLSALAGLPAGLAAGTAPHSLKRLGAALGAYFLDWPESDGGDPFANANTPDDLLALQRRAALAASS